MTAFEEFGVLPEIARAVEEMEWTLPTDVQAEAIPLILGGGDVLMAAETGSGKTGAFCLPILQIVWETIKDLNEGKGKGHAPAMAYTIPAWTMSMFDRNDGLAVTPDGLRCQSRDQSSWNGCRATTGVGGSGVFYYEATVTDEGLCRVGWSTQRSNLDLGTDKYSFGYGGTGMKSFDRDFTKYGGAFGINETIGCWLDTVRMEIGFTKNGVNLGVAFQVPQHLRNEAFYPAVVLKNAEMSFNFRTPAYPMPSGAIEVSAVPPMYQVENPMAGGCAGGTDQFKPRKNAPQAIIIEPTRELAEQTLNQLQKFKKFLRNPVVNELLLVGGMNVRDQIASFNHGVDIVVATAGRLEDMIAGGHVSLTHCRFFVLDEADGLLAAGLGKMIDNLHRQIPKITSDGRRLQMVVCSATLHSFDVKNMAKRLMHFPTWVDLKGEDAVPETVHHVVAMIDPLEDGRWKSLGAHIQTDGVHARDPIGPGRNSPETFSEAIKMLKAEYLLRAIDEHQMDRALLFCRTKLDCDNLERFLKSRGAKYSCVCLHGDRAPAERKANLEAFRQQQVKFLISTDMAARGLDIKGLPFMINMTLPDEKSNYVHRIGRVGRADRMGLAISLVSTVPEKVWYHGQNCKNGKTCTNTSLADAKGCCIWYNEKNILAEIEDYLTITIEHVDKDIKVPVNQFDGKVVYGEKRKKQGSGYQDHVTQLVPVVKRLAELESSAQTAFLKRAYLC